MNVLALSIVLPTYNERENLRLLVPGIEAAFHDVAHETLVVDDSSPDGTAEMAEQLRAGYPAVRLVRRPAREGLGAALRHGYDAACGTIILSADSDGSFTPDAMRALFEACTPGVDLVVGTRHLPGGAYDLASERGALKRALSRLGNWAFRRMTGLPVREFSVNFRAIRRCAWERLHTHERSNAFLLEMIAEAAWQDLVIREFPVQVGDRIHGESKLRLSREGPEFVRAALALTLRRRAVLRARGGRGAGA
jgi:dolichol-phosphate mannosyltransferase